MAQLHFTLDSDFFVGLFSETKDEAFGKLMEALLNQVLQAESTEQLGANNYERSQERSDYRNGTYVYPYQSHHNSHHLVMIKHSIESSFHAFLK